MFHSYVTIVAEIPLFIPAHNIGLSNEIIASDNLQTTANVNMLRDFRVLANC
jgi:hypothetical protein